MPASPARWEDPRLAAETRARLHLSTADLPPFPNENRALLDPSKWPAALEDSVSRCRLELNAWQRSGATRLRSLRDLKAGQTLTARYLCIRRGWKAPRYGGPLYAWSAGGRLEERSYRDSDGARYRERLYQYRTNGLLWAYRDRERNENEGGPWSSLDEYFDPDGTLAGFQLARVDGVADSTIAALDTTAVRWWRGSPVDEATFRARVASFATHQ